jgi:salicylate hydroxylase
VARVQRLAEKQGRIYHMSGPMAVARDLSIRLLGPKRMLARQRWIHDWKA